MIVCFTGTGNTRYVSDLLQDALGDELVRFPPGLMREPWKINMRVLDDRVIWAFPVFCWGIPVKAEHIIRNAKLTFDKDTVHHMVCTCGDDIGNTEKQWRALMAELGYKAGSAYSVQMPNTFTFMKGFDVDPPELAKSKLDAAPARVAYIAERINSGVVESDVVRGTWPWVKSSVIRPWFNRVKVDISKFHTTDACVGCGRCARNCPFGAIEMVDGRPVWKGECTLCSRCYHCCPNHAVAYLGATKGKGQYICPEYSLVP